MSRDHKPLSAHAFHVLLALADGPLHGYGLMRRITEEGGLAVGPGTVYGALHRMQRAGWVEEAGRDPGRGPLKHRQSFRLTEAGRQVLRVEAERAVRAADLIRANNVLGDE